MKSILLAVLLLLSAWLPAVSVAQTTELELVQVISPASGTYLTRGQSYPVTIRIKNNTTTTFNGQLDIFFLVGSNQVLDSPNLTITAGSSIDYTLATNFVWNDTTTKFGSASFTPGITDLNPNNNVKNVAYNGYVLGTSDQLAQQFSIRAYPTVANQTLTFSASQAPKGLRLVSLMGQEVRRTQPTTLEVRFDVSNVAPGVYFLQAEYPAGTWTSRVVITR